MLDSSSTCLMQRSAGVAEVTISARGLRRLSQRGSAKALLPHVRGMPEIVFLNTSGGLTSGDRLTYKMTLEAGARAVATTQAAERAYRADQGMAEVDVHHRVGAHGWLDWLPQETILFDRAKLRRRTVIDLAAEAGCVMLEAVVLGRGAMREVVADLQFSDIREVRRGGKTILIEPFVQNSDILALGARSALLSDARAFATMALCAKGAEDAVETARRALDVEGVEGAASGFDGKCLVRLLAADAWPLRQQILKLMTVLRRGAPPPRVWQI